MNINISRANIYLVDDCDFVVAIDEEQAKTWSKKEYGEDCGTSAVWVDGTKKYFIDDEIEISKSQKIEYMLKNEGKELKNHEPLKVLDYEIVLNQSFNFLARRTLQRQLEIEINSQTLFEVPFCLASTEY